MDQTIQTTPVHSDGNIQPNNFTFNNDSVEMTPVHRIRTEALIARTLNPLAPQLSK